MLRLLLLSASLALVLACNPGRRVPDDLVTFATSATVQELPLPICDPAAPPAFVQRRDAATPRPDPMPWTRLIVRVVSADTLRAHITSLPIMVRQSGRMRTASVEPSGPQVIDSLLPGPAELDVRSFAFNRLRDTIEIRASYVDTLIVGLTAACK